MTTAETTLRGLYPFLHGERQDAALVDEGLLESIRAKAEDSRAVSARFFAANAEGLIRGARALADIWRSDGKLFAMGNGGSSCDAAHITVEFVHPITAGRPALATVNLGADLASLTAVGNDVGFDQVFARQIAAQARRGDGLVGISTSGNSANLIAGYEAAKALGVVTFGLAGGDGGRMLSCGLVDHCLVVESASIHRVQECHVTAYHVLWDLVHTLLADDRGSARGEARP
jgi:D-sedoheptulose 7-phosphate isomerase